MGVSEALDLEDLATIVPSISEWVNENFDQEMVVEVNSFLRQLLSARLNYDFLSDEEARPNLTVPLSGSRDWQQAPAKRAADIGNELWSMP